MENQLVWEDRFNIGVSFIDREHKKLFTIMNRLFAVGEREKKKEWVYQEVIKYFKDHALKHFAEEEAYMASISYGGFEMHRRLHEDFRQETLPTLERELQRTRYSQNAVDHFLGVCAGWLIGHTLTEDRAIVMGGTSKWKNLLAKEEQLFMKNTIIELLNAMFQVDAEIVSESYGGEKFGDGIYYRLTYGTETGYMQDIVLVFEEKLLINTVGKILGFKTKKVDVTLMNAVRYVARQFVQSIRERFPDEEKYHLLRENLLTYEQFEDIFAKRLPQYSLLFHMANAEYFAYCAMTPYKMKGKIGASIQADNAMEEVKRYLDNNEKENSSGKKKILVVDDSETIRQVMKGMLQDDYQVTVAQSGLAAIRCMALEQQDLMLLDYTMPDCDGEQLLKMIRSEDGLSEIPVIFLSATVDKERIGRLVGLKPVGYLLKSMPPEEIKKNIDDFFRKKSGVTNSK